MAIIIHYNTLNLLSNSTKPVFYLSEIFKMVWNTYYWKYLTSNLTSMYLLTVYSGEQLNQSQIRGLIIACKWVFDVKFWCIVYLRIHKVKNLMSNTNSMFCTFSDRWLWPSKYCGYFYICTFESLGHEMFNIAGL